MTAKIFGRTIDKHIDVNYDLNSILNILNIYALIILFGTEAPVPKVYQSLADLIGKTPQLELSDYR